jgi:SpoVK/Ycf46/Vps4 family AAA+-type ATPase
MARADQVKALLTAYAGNDESRFLSIALQVAADAAQRGHAKFATELRDLVEAARHQSVRPVGTKPAALAQPRGELAELLTVQYPQHHLSEMVLDPAIHARIERVLLEQRQQQRLTGHGLRARRKLLLVGPPGTGKTLSASVLATELRLPLFTARFDSLITKFMGESASKLKTIFDALGQTRGVYLFDEFDSLGLERGSQHDVAEMRRTLNMFLQLIEQDDSDSLIVAATNHGQALDKALFRRFDDVIRYGLPHPPEVELLLRNNLAMLAPGKMDYSYLVACAAGLSHSDIVRACRDAMKDAVLSDSEMDPDQVAAHLKERAQSSA